MSTVIAGIIRWALTMGGAWLSGHGYTTTGDVAEITSNVELIAGSVVAIAPLVWGIWKNWQASKVKKAAVAAGVVPK